MSKVVASAAETLQVVNVMRLALRLAKAVPWKKRLEIAERSGFPNEEKRMRKKVRVPSGSIIVHYNDKIDPHVIQFSLFHSKYVTAWVNGKTNVVLINRAAVPAGDKKDKLVKAAAAVLGLRVHEKRYIYYVPGMQGTTSARGRHLPQVVARRPSGTVCNDLSFPFHFSIMCIRTIQRHLRLAQFNGTAATS